MKKGSKNNNILQEILRDLENDTTVKARIQFTGYNKIDDRLQGNNPGSVIFIGARPGMGKTSFVLNIALNLSVNYQLAVFIIASDLSEKEILQKMISICGGVGEGCFKRPLTNGEVAKIGNAVANISQAPIFIQSLEHVTTQEIFLATEQIDRTLKWGAIIIDVLLFKASEQQGSLDIAKKISRELQCPVFVTGLLSRAVERRQVKRPCLSDIRGDEIENRMDVGLFLYRDDYYNRYPDDPDTIEVLFLKNKSGGIGYVRLGWNGKLQRINENVPNRTGPKKIDWNRLHMLRSIVFPTQWTADCNSHDMKIRYLKNAYDLEVEGYMQGNCIADFRADILNNKIQIYHSLINERDIIFSLKKDNEKIFLSEVKARFNNEPQPIVIENLLNYLVMKCPNFCTTD
ncbi:MAG: DnaB-like helicase C-terminal domain-containing protein [Bdellovibrionota bacterium]